IVSRGSPATGRFASGSALCREPVLRPLPIYRGPLRCPLAPSGEFVAAERDARSAETAEPRISRRLLPERWSGAAAAADRDISLSTSREHGERLGTSHSGGTHRRHRLHLGLDRAARAESQVLGCAREKRLGRIRESG